jgi:hypothetical protein
VVEEVLIGGAGEFWKLFFPRAALVSIISDKYNGSGHLQVRILSPEFGSNITVAKADK